MDTKCCSDLFALRKKFLHLFHTTDTSSDISIVQVPRVMSFTSVAFEQNTLSQSVCVQIHFLCIVISHQKWILCMTVKIHCDTNRHSIRHQFRTNRIIHNRAICNRSILPIYSVIIIFITCNNNFGRWHLVSLILYTVLCTLLIGPICAAKTCLFYTIYSLCDFCNSLPVSGYIVLRVAPQSGTQFII